METKVVKGIHLPAWEEHLSWMIEKHGKVIDGRGTYQYHKYEKVLPHVRQRRNAIDVGGHCGLWSMHMVKDFQKVFAFEPLEEHRNCFTKNVIGGAYELYPVALGNSHGQVRLNTGHPNAKEESSGDTWVVPNNMNEKDLVKVSEVVDMKMLDDYAELVDIDFIKIDCEGFEVFVLKGGEELLKREDPVICVEQKEGFGAKYGIQDTTGLDYLKSLGYKIVGGLQGDYFLKK